MPVASTIAVATALSYTTFLGISFFPSGIEPPSQPLAVALVETV